MHQCTKVIEKAIRVYACSAGGVLEKKTLGHRLHETYFFSCETDLSLFYLGFSGYAELRCIKFET